MVNILKINFYTKPYIKLYKALLCVTTVIFLVNNPTKCRVHEHEEAIELNNSFKFQQLDNITGYITIDRTNTNINQASKCIYKPYDQKIFIFGGETPAMWLRFSINNITQLWSEYILDVSTFGLDYSEVYLQDSKNKTVKLSQLNRRQLVWNRTIPNGRLLYTITLNPNSKYTIFVKTAPKHERHKISLLLYSKQEFLRFIFFDQSFFFLSIGFLSLATTASLLLFFFLFKKIYWQYSLYILSLITVILTFSGYLDPFLLQIPFLKYDNTYTLIIYLCIAIHLTFSNNYLSANSNSPTWFSKLGKSITSISMILTTLYFLPFDAIHSYLDILNYYLLLLAELYLLINIIQGIRHKHTPSIVYFIRFVAYILGAIAYMFNLFFFEYVYQIVDWLLIASILEVLFLALGISISYIDTLKKQEVITQILNQRHLQIIYAQETERQRIAQDLHDEVGNALAALKNLIIQKFNDQGLSEKVKKIAQDVRNISHNLASIDFESISLSAAFQDLIIRHNEFDNIDYELIEIGKPYKLPSEKELVIYRITCELLNNIQKHAKAQKATIQLVYQTEALTIITEDDGIGIKSKANQPKGIGLKHIHERVLYLNGKLTIDDDGKGTIIIVDIPT